MAAGAFTLHWKNSARGTNSRMSLGRCLRFGTHRRPSLGATRPLRSNHRLVAMQRTPAARNFRHMNMSSVSSAWSKSAGEPSCPKHLLRHAMIRRPSGFISCNTCLWEPSSATQSLVSTFLAARLLSFFWLLVRSRVVALRVQWSCVAPQEEGTRRKVSRGKRSKGKGKQSFKNCGKDSNGKGGGKNDSCKNSEGGESRFDRVRDQAEKSGMQFCHSNTLPPVESAICCNC